ncbi:major capsid protein [Methylobacterium oryzae]|uniref:major capsid protein n=1 Tax=Methylobacterium oryzae TaxID=334852 RepID=UPI002F2DA4EC
MTQTLLSNMLIPDKWADYVIQKTVAKSLLFRSGIASDLGDNEDIKAQLLASGGKTVNLPFYNDLSGSEQLIDDTTDLTINNIGTSKDVAAVMMRAQVFGASDLAADLAGDDPLDAIASRFADYWIPRMQTALVSTLAGALGSSGMTSNVLDISGNAGAAAIFSGEAFIDATAKLGDYQDSLTAIAVHSAVYALMKKLDLIEFQQDSQGGEPIPTYQGKTLIVDDGMPVSSGVYTSYLFARGAIAYAEGKPKVPAATDRDELKSGGMEFIVNRKKWIMHPRGIKWSGTAAGPTPSNAELATTTNWTRVYDPKNIRIVQFKYKIA